MRPATRSAASLIEWLVNDVKRWVEDRDRGSGAAADQCLRDLYARSDTFWRACPPVR